MATGNTLGQSMFDIKHFLSQFNRLACQLNKCHLPPSLSHTAALMDTYCEHVFAEAIITFMNQSIMTRPCLRLHHYNFQEHASLLGGLC